MTEILYMDHRATTPAEKSVLSAMSDYWEKVLEIHTLMGMQ